MIRQCMIPQMPLLQRAIGSDRQPVHNRSIKPARDTTWNFWMHIAGIMHADTNSIIRYTRPCTLSYHALYFSAQSEYIMPLIQSVSIIDRLLQCRYVQILTTLTCGAIRPEPQLYVCMISLFCSSCYDRQQPSSSNLPTNICVLPACRDHNLI